MTMRSVRWSLIIAWRETWTAYRHPLSLLWLVVVPLMFALVASNLFTAGGGAPRVAVVDLDNSAASAALIRGLEQTPYQVDLITREEAGRLVGSGRLSSALIIPEGFEASVAAGSPRLEIIQGPAMSQDGLAGRARTLAQALAAGRDLAPLAVVNEPPLPSAGADFNLLRVTWGIFTMFVLATALQRSGSIHSERSAGTLQRMLVLDVPYGVIVAGHGLGLVLVGTIQACIFLLVTGLLGVPWLGAGFAVLAVQVLVTIVACAGLGMALAGMTRSALQARGIASVLTPALAMIGGGFWPLEVVPAAMQEVARLSPVYWSIEALREGLVYSGTVAGQALPSAVLALYGVLGMILGVHGLRRLVL